MNQPTIQHDASLKALNTFGVDVQARELLTLDTPDDLPAALNDLPAEDLLILGGGSNILFTKAFPGRIVRLVAGSETADIKVEKHPGRDTVTVGAGMNWDSFVRWSLQQGYAGLENLILIPGSVGAAPIQNIGAYGREVSEFIASVDVYDRQQHEFRKLDTAACHFAYRDSIFKQQRGRFIVTAVNFSLPRDYPLRTDYAGVQEALNALGIVSPQPADVARVVEALRLEKLPDPARIGNAGSFFKNPVVTGHEAERLRSNFPDLPMHDTGDGHKLSAAWLIQACGLKGFREGDAGISEQHALVLVNHGNATGMQLWDVARKVIAETDARFGIRLEPEPLVL